MAAVLEEALLAGLAVEGSAVFLCGKRVLVWKGR
jgi:hypothetical protein